ncbi:hydantoinase/oxoprolinase family protein [Nonomuraea sp. KC401]|uniref:hydantoinase/oxoprolinase family protein n=1 Tax=unclassified Nonomuraea TaxID=2593643 RepID=UPI0010FF04C5|nr:MULTISPECIES: hydantoinase/oxoprolinase family protein [unclassified Nonomuraea]NBE96697.1 hydantoinase/oxoprolinase family protein [Nonomuraea sp. K271]TLF63113.1 hydantoinase/oxoprolinase family protein [Nonomuraea sp. KC401]
MGFVIGVDVGGTFTDVVLRAKESRRGTLAVAKVLSTHYDPIAGILAGVTRALGDRDPAQVERVVHATTLATNAVLERTGVRVAYVTTQGFRATIPLGRYARVEEDRYDLRFTPPPPPVAPGDCFEVVERISARGTVLTPLDPGSVRGAAAAIARRGIESAAVCLLHAYANPAHERQVAAILRESVKNVVTSSDVWPEIREYERATTTIMSAYIGPLMASYLSRLRERLAGIGIDAPIHVMESSGGVISAELAARRAVATIESGPAAGVLAAAGAGFADAISFDMGGTTAKACVVRGGRPEITHEFHVGGKGSFGGRRAGTGVPIKTPAIDLAEVGAGGGSVAWLDQAGALRVGPRSAGSSPGPACYGLGGREPTVTDANLVLGYLSSASIPLFPGLAGEALDRLAGPLGVPRERAAYAVHEIVSASMASAVHVVTVQRGIDPRGFALVAFGGAGPTHAARVAERFGIGTVVVPPYCGVASAAGLLSGELSTDRVLSRLDAPDPEAVFAALASEAATDLGVSPGSPGVRVSRSVDVRFQGQAHDLTVPWSADLALLESRFFQRYAEVYGFTQPGPIELVGYRVRVTMPPEDTHGDRYEDLPPDTQAHHAGAGVRRAYFPETDGYVEVPVHTRSTMGAGLRGPAVVEDAESAIVVPPGWSAALTGSRAVHLTRSLP